MAEFIVCYPLLLTAAPCPPVKNDHVAPHVWMDKKEVGFEAIHRSPIFKVLIPSHPQALYARRPYRPILGVLNRTPHRKLIIQGAPMQVADDIVVRVRTYQFDDGYTGAIVDARSRSHAKADHGVNAKRLRKFLHDGDSW